MARQQPLAATERLDLRTVDPARAWVLVGDLARLPEWTSAVRVDGAPAEPAVDDELSARHRLGPLRYRVDYVVRSWEAGRRFRLGAEGWPLASGGEWRVAVEAMVEHGGTWTRLELTRSASAPALARPLAAWLVRRELRASLRKLEAALA